MENINLKFSEGDTDVIIREGKAPDIVQAKSIAFKGDIRTVANWLTTKQLDTDLMKAVLEINYRDGHIELTLNADQENGRIASLIAGKMQSNADLEAFRINGGYAWQLTDLADFLKFNRRYFVDKSANMDIVSGLKNFRGIVNREIEKMSDDRGNHRRLDHKEVTTKLPEVFTLYMPLFENEPPTDFDVEIIIEEKEGIVRVKLQSVSLLEKREAAIMTAIDAQLERIKDLGITTIYL